MNKKKNHSKIIFVIIILSFLISCSSAVIIQPRLLGEIIFNSKNLPPQLDLLDPSLNGEYEVSSFYYGSLLNPKREEYQQNNVSVITQSVNISDYFNNIDSDYWGFDARKVPINGKIWYPEDKTDVSPLVLCVHGNHDPFEYSEFGYAYLGEMLASRGIIFATIDENFLNGSGGGENDARAVLLLIHTHEILKWNEKENIPLYKKIDVNKIAFIGHSRGGEAVVTAAIFNRMKYYPENGNITFDWNFPIKAVISLAPVEGQYRPAGRLLSPKDVNYLLLHGSHDGDVNSFNGSRFFNRNLPDDGLFRSSFWIYGGNHIQFNTIWAEAKQDPKPTYRMNLISEEEQQYIAKVTISAFLEVSFDRNKEYLKFFKDYRKGLQWLPQTLYITQYQDNKGYIIANFEDDDSFYTANLDNWECSANDFLGWKESPLPLKSGDQESWALFLRCGRNTPIFKLYTKDNPISGDVLAFDIAFLYLYNNIGTNTETLDFTIKIGTIDNKFYKLSLSDVYTLPLLPDVWILNTTKKHFILQTILIPLKLFNGYEKNNYITSIEFVFDKTKNCYIAIDNIILKKGADY